MNPKNNLIKFQNDWNINIGADRKIAKNVHFCKVMIDVRTCTVSGKCLLF